MDNTAPDVVHGVGEDRDGDGVSAQHRHRRVELSHGRLAPVAIITVTGFILNIVL